MNTIIVVGHGEFATGLESAMTQIIGQQKYVSFINFNEAKTPEQLQQEIKDHISGNKVLFLTDILGGTPFRLASSISQEMVESEVIAGTNLQMLIESAMEANNVGFSELVNLAKESGIRGITVLSEQLTKSKKSKNIDGI